MKYQITIDFIFVLISLADCEYITSSTINKCYGESSEPTDCSEKLVAVLTLENG